VPSPNQGTTSISGGSLNPLSASQALILLSLSSHALHTPPPKTRVWRRHPSAEIISPVTVTELLDEIDDPDPAIEDPGEEVLVYDRRRGNSGFCGLVREGGSEVVVGDVEGKSNSMVTGEE